MICPLRRDDVLESVAIEELVQRKLTIPSTQTIPQDLSKTLPLIFGINLLTVQSLRRMKGRLPLGLPEVPSQDSSSPSSPSQSLSRSSSPSSTSPSSLTISSSPSLHNFQFPHQEIGLTFPSLTTRRSFQAHDLNQRPRRSPLLRGLMTIHLSPLQTSIYLQAMDVS